MDNEYTGYDTTRIELLINFMRVQSGTDAPVMDFFAALSGRLNRFGHDIRAHGLVLSEQWKTSEKKTVSIIELQKPSWEIEFTIADDDAVVIKRTGRQTAQSFQMPEQRKAAISEVLASLIEALPSKTRDHLYEVVTETPHFQDAADIKLHDIKHGEEGTFSKSLLPKTSFSKIPVSKAEGAWSYKP